MNTPATAFAAPVAAWADKISVLQRPPFVNFAGRGVHGFSAHHLKSARRLRVMVLLTAVGCPILHIIAFLLGLSGKAPRLTRTGFCKVQ